MPSRSSRTAARSASRPAARRQPTTTSGFRASGTPSAACPAPPPPGNKLAGENGWTEIDACPLITDDDGNKAVQGLTDILAANPDLTAFISTGAFTQWYDNAYRQAVAPYKEKMDSGALSIIVADTLPMQMAQLADGLSNGQVGQRPFEMGYKSMFILRDLVKGMAVDDPIYTGLDVCTMDNADTCLAQ